MSDDKYKRMMKPDVTIEYVLDEGSVMTTERETMILGENEYFEIQKAPNGGWTVSTNRGNFERTKLIGAYTSDTELVEGLRRAIEQMRTHEVKS